MFSPSKKWTCIRKKRKQVLFFVCNGSLNTEVVLRNRTLGSVRCTAAASKRTHSYYCRIKAAKHVKKQINGSMAISEKQRNSIAKKIVVYCRLNCLHSTPSKGSRLFFFWRSKHFIQYFLCMSWCFSRSVIGCWENAQKLTCHRRLPVWFHRSKTAFCKHFSVKIAAVGSLKRVTLQEGFSKLESN